MPITPEYLKSILAYSPETGVFTWLVSRSRTPAGSIAGSLVSSGYLTVMIDRKRHNLHRLAFVYMLDRHPPEFVDHINGQKTDNRWINLRAASPVENARNQKRSCKNSSGISGVSWDSRGLWRSFGYLAGKQITLGRYSSKFDAAAARKSFENSLGYHENHGR